ncbi:MAG: hypothetical protein RLZZ301_1469 [Bacteroidota bacterium]|jgi:hypothetical protein
MSTKRLFSIVVMGLLFTACEQANPSACACLKQAKKVNQLSQKIWSQTATHSDSVQMRNALIKKETKCQQMADLSPEEVASITAKCQ